MYARPVGPVGRVLRWGRRKPLAAALLLTLVVGFGSSLLLWLQSEAAHRESEEHVAMLRHLMTNHVNVRASLFHRTNETDLLPEALLLDAEACLTQLLEQRPADQEMRILLADVLTCLGMRRGSGERVALLEKAAHLWEEIPPARGREPTHLISRAATYRCLGFVYGQQGRLDQAVPAVETAFRLCKQLVEDHPDPLYQDGLYYAAMDLGGFLLDSGHSEEEVWRRFQGLGLCPILLGSHRTLDVLRDSLRVEHLCMTAERHYQAHAPDAGLAAARKAAAIFDRYDHEALLDRTNCVRLARPAVMVSTALRHGEVPREALRLAERVNRWLQDRAPAAPEADYFMEISQLWQQIGKARWKLGQAEDTLGAYRHALAALRQAYTLAPAVLEYREELGRLYIRLGRKLCELGRLNEAEACFREREVLFPAEASRQEALRELQKWAAQVGKEGKDLSPAQQQERQRYLDLRARLENHAIRPLPVLHDGSGLLIRAP